MDKKAAGVFEYRCLQIAIGVFGLVPVGAGLSGVVSGTRMVDRSAASISLDSHYRYLSGLLLALGLAYWAMIPTLWKQSEAFRLLTFLVFIGGLSRLSGIFIEGLPSKQMQGGLLMELAVTPLLCLWQARLSKVIR